MPEFEEQYVMVTDFPGHWDRLRTRMTSFPVGMMVFPMTVERLQENMPTVFVKKDKNTGKLERVWRGSVANFRRDPSDPGKYFFSVNATELIVDPTIARRFEQFRNGWYLQRTDANGNGEPGSRNSEATDWLRPAFLRILKTTENWKDFEAYTAYLLKVLGVNTIHPYPPDSQRGLPDGFFRLRNLAVLYDCTLEQNYESAKKNQIENYCRQLLAGAIETGEREVEPISSCERQVWIVTRGTKRELLRFGEIVVKEVPIEDLIRLYDDKLLAIETERNLEARLRDL